MSILCIFTADLFYWVNFFVSFFHITKSTGNYFSFYCFLWNKSFIFRQTGLNFLSIINFSSHVGKALWQNNLIIKFQYVPRLLLHCNKNQNALEWIS